MKLGTYLGPAQRAKSLEVVWFLFHVTDEQSVSIPTQITSSFLRPIIMSGMWGGTFICCLWNFVSGREDIHMCTNPLKFPAFKNIPQELLMKFMLTSVPRVMKTRKKVLITYPQIVHKDAKLRQMLVVDIWLTYCWIFYR